MCAALNNKRSSVHSNQGGSDLIKDVLAHAHIRMLSPSEHMFGAVWSLIDRIDVRTEPDIRTDAKGGAAFTCCVRGLLLVFVHSSIIYITNDYPIANSCRLSGLLSALCTMPGGSRQGPRIRIEDSDSDGMAPVANPPQRSRGCGCGCGHGRSRGNRHGQHQMPVQSDQEEIDITLSDRSVSKHSNTTEHLSYLHSKDFTTTSCCCDHN